VSTEHTPARREALLDLAQIKCDELLVDMRFLLALYDKYKRGRSPRVQTPSISRRFRNTCVAPQNAPDPLQQLMS
jgi:hypothetical protein